MMKINWFSGVVQGVRCYWSNFVSSFSPRKFRYCVDFASQGS
jgi:hypothetical protein